MAQKVMTGNKDFTVEQTKDGISYESKELKTTKEVFKVAKKERTEDGYMITTTGGSEYEVFEGWNEYDEDDIKLIRKGSVAAYLGTEEKGFLVCGFSPDFIQKEIKKYFSGAEDKVKDGAEEEVKGEMEEGVKGEVEDEYASLILILNENDEENKFAVLEKRKLVGNTEKIAEFKYTHFKMTKPSVIYMRGIELYDGTELLAALEVNEIEEIFDDLEGMEEAEEKAGESGEAPACTLDTIESKLKNYDGGDIKAFIEIQIEHFITRRTESSGEEKAHYQKQLDISGTALSIYKNMKTRRD